MSIEAIVWLTVGTGVGIALSMLALVLFAAAERRDLRRRQRATKPVASPETASTPANGSSAATPTAAPPATAETEPPAKPDGPLNVEALFAEAFAAPKQPALPALTSLDAQEKPPPY